MKNIFLASLSLLLFFSCAPQKTLQPDRDTTPAVADVKITISPVMPQVYKSYLKCDDNTEITFNSSGLEVLPFLRPVFYDMQTPGVQDMIVGSKEGALRLYKIQNDGNSLKFKLVENYFKGIKAGVFSAPALGDLDNDGKPELLVGTGGFSSDSGRILIYKNAGSPYNPEWDMINIPEIRVGNDATPAVFDVDNDGRPDLISGNSTGSLFLFRNKSREGKIVFIKDPEYFRGINLGMYAAPSITSEGNRIIIIAGNSMGKLYIMERQAVGRSSWQKSKLNIGFSNFTVPAFYKNDISAAKDLVIADGDGKLYYFRNSNKDYRNWQQIPGSFTGRILPGPACSPGLCEINDRSFMVVGNINGEIKLFEKNNPSEPLPWKEKAGFFRNIKLSSFSKGVLTEWEEKYLLITGQQDGAIRAFLNSGTIDNPKWSEQKQFFKSLPKIYHASVSVFDLDDDGKWELIAGDSDGYIKGFRYEISNNGTIIWKVIDESFRNIKVDRFAAPTLFSDSDKIYLLAGQQDGRIIIYSAIKKHSGYPVFYKDDYLYGIQVNNHSSPSAFMKDGVIEIAVGDYNGNLKHYACRNSMMEVKEN